MKIFLALLGLVLIVAGFAAGLYLSSAAGFAALLVQGLVSLVGLAFLMVGLSP